ncbi:FecR family protein [Chitinophaga niastensis]|uniref:FecR family protein n=1 Tax=Chitinophaga niastensis TaxID=536980 RepID=A0A2P8HKF0_CHINA|nr:FecR family protein [Chitinophaga niastensis]PSL46698.1 FecR family protein [Chitinophaga niastensis]
MKRMNQAAIISIIEKYAQGILLSQEEEVLLTSWMQQVKPSAFQALLDQCENIPDTFRAYPQMPDTFKATLEARIDQQEQQEKVDSHTGIFYLYGKKIAVAATIALMVIAGSFVYKHYRAGGKEVVAQQQPQNTDPAPGGNRAVLTLADGSTIVLDSAKNGVLSQQGNTQVIKLSNGQLAYNASKSNGEAPFNTITTPNGGQYHIELPDGTGVWLNAASSLRFPASFSGATRTVELIGEGYFEVAKNAAMPFIVQSKEATVEVLGTHFNMNAYEEEGVIKTTLLEGAVKFHDKTAVLRLIPGQQGQLFRNGTMQLIKDADVDQAVAWKNGYFQFDGIDLAALIRQIARWYNLEVVYEDKVPEREFTGKISRTVYLSEVIKALELSDVHCRLNGNRLIVMP